MSIQDDFLSDLSRRNGAEFEAQDYDLKAYREHIDGKEKIAIASARQVDKILRKIEKDRNIEMLKENANSLKKEVEQRQKALKALNDEEKAFEKSKIKELQRQQKESNKKYLEATKEAENEALEIALAAKENYYKTLSFKEKQAFLEREKNEIQSAKQVMALEHEIALLREANIERRQQLQDEYEKRLSAYNEKEIENAEKLSKVEQISYKYATADERKDFLKRKIDASKESLRNAEKEKDMALLTAESDEERCKALTEYIKNRQEAQNDLISSEKEYKDLIDAELDAQDKVEKKMGKISAAQAKERRAGAYRDFADKYRKEAVDLTTRMLSEIKASPEKEAEIRQRYEKQIADAEKNARQYDKQASAQQMQANLLKGISNGIANLSNMINSKVSQGIEVLKSFQSPLMARLQGASTSYSGALKLLKSNLAVSPYVSYQKTLENLSKLVEAGVAYNIEERAFLSTISDKIATTFDAFDSNLLRLIRLQQADTTAARMGMEAYLTRFLNSLFSDTSYLSDMYDTVEAAIVDGMSQVSYGAGTEYEFMLQKWLGSLYALGLSQGAVSKIAEGVNMLSTGDVQGLASNAPIQSLLAMSASRSGTVDYASVLTDGLNASELNDLMKSMVEYLREIASNSDSRVVKAAYGDIFGMSVSDFASIQNLKNEDITSIYKTTLSYQNSLGELINQFNQVGARMSIAELAGNVVNNTLFTAAEGIAELAPLYVTWLLADALEKTTGGIKFPTVSWLGNFVDLSMFTLEGILKNHMVGLSTFASMPSIIRSLSNGGGLNRDIWGAWNATQTTERGTGIGTLPSGVDKGTSYSGYIGSGSGSDIKKQSLQQVYEESGDVADITNPNREEEKDFQDLWKALFEEPQEIQVHSESFDSFVKRLLDNKEAVATISVGTGGIGSNSIMSYMSYDATSSNTLDEINRISSQTSSEALDVNVTNDVHSEITNIDNTIVENIAKALAASSAYGSQASSANNNSMYKYIKEIVEKVVNGTLNVNVTNSNFDAFLDKSLFQF